MPALAWQLPVLAAMALSLAGRVWRAASIARLPLHLRWELAPVPFGGDKESYGGSYLEDSEWWTRPRRRSWMAPLVYSAKEARLLRSVWRHNRGLWPLSFSLHLGVHLTAGLCLGTAIHAMLAGARWLASAPHPVLSALFLLAYLSGLAGAIGLLSKRTLDPRLRPFNSFSRDVNLPRAQTACWSSGTCSSTTRRARSSGSCSAAWPN